MKTSIYDFGVATIIMCGLLALCLTTCVGCSEVGLKKGVFKNDKQSFEIVDDNIIKIDGKPYQYTRTGGTVWLPNSTYHVQERQKLLLANVEMKPGCILPDMSGEYVWQEPQAETVLPLDQQINQLKTSGDSQLNRLTKLKDVHAILNQKINEKTKKLKDMGVKSANELNPETKPIAQELVALCKERDKIIKAEDAALTKLKTIETALQQFAQDVPDKTLDEILANLPEKKSPVESIEANEILNTQLKGE